MNGEVFCFDAVAPARERGLKNEQEIYTPGRLGRSREGAWIEKSDRVGSEANFWGRSREGAWIENLLI